MGFRFNVRRSLGAGLIPGGGGAILKPQDVFATSLWTGNATDRTIPTGFKPDLMWHKQRNNAGSNTLADTQRGTNVLFTDTTGAESNFGANAMSSQDTGVGVISSAAINNSGNSNVLWAWKRAAKFFDIVTWTGDSTSARKIPHGLGVPPGLIVIKSRTQAVEWPAYHIGTGNTMRFALNTTAAAVASGVFNSAAPTATDFTINNPGSLTNEAGNTYVAYLFAHDPSADGIVQCGSFTLDANGQATVTAGWPTQYVLMKRTNSADAWYIIDTARGWGAGADKGLVANSANAEFSADLGSSTSTGFTVANVGNGGDAYIYLAIRAPY